MGEALRISYISPFPPTRHGIGTYTHYLVSALTKVAPRSKFLIVADKGTRKRATPDLKVVPCFDLSEALRDDERPEYAEDLIRVVSNFTPNIIHVQHGASVFRLDERFLHLLERLREHGKLVVTLHAVFTERTNAWGDNVVSVDQYHRKLGLLVDAIIVHQNPMRDALIEQGVNGQRIRVIPHGTEILEQVDKSQARRKFGLPGGHIILAAGFFDHQKNNELLVESMPHVLKDVPDAHLFFAGYVREWIPADAEQRVLYEERAKELGVQRHVTFAEKFIPDHDMHLPFAAADVAVFPFRQDYVSYHEFLSASGSLHLAIGAFKPIVVSRVPKFEEAWTEISSAIAFDNRRPAQLASTLVRVLVDDDFRVYITERVRSYALRTSWDVIARAHSGLYSSLSSS